MNEQIEATEVRLIAEDGEQLGITPLDEAIRQATAAGLELVQISNADPVVAKIMDLGKKLYEEKKSKAIAKKKQVQVQVKEIKFRPNTDIGDYNVKLRNLIRFLEE
ncbi:translation initiation factor IF-3, partial [Reinekea sp.]|uniref:translation initiation factor IF-3 n=1 Tax=Reinekea sp. TaxID=1970455 RepID=UPI0039897AAF